MRDPNKNRTRALIIMCILILCGILLADITEIPAFSILGVGGVVGDGRFYKIFVTKQFKVTPKMMYHYNDVTHKYDELVSTAYVKELISLSAYARAVG